MLEANLLINLQDNHYPRPIRETTEDIIPCLEWLEEEELRADIK